MTTLLKQSTSYTFRFGPFVDSTDGFTEENALTIAYTSVYLSKAGAALAAKNDTTNLTSTGANGHYTCVLNTTDTGTVGELRVYANISGALPVFKDFLVVPAHVYDGLVAGTDNLQVDAIQFAGTAYATALAAEVDAVWDEQVDGSVTARQSTRLANAALGGKASGLGTTTAVYRDLADTTDRISATVDADGNRTAVTRTLT